MKRPRPMDPRRALVDEAGKLYVMRQELRTLRKQRDSLDAQIQRLEQQVAAAKAALETALERAAAPRRRRSLENDPTQDLLTPGKLPHRVHAHMRREPARIYTAGEIAAALETPDVQKVRTALARLVGKGLVRRLGPRGEFTL